MKVTGWISIVLVASLAGSAKADGYCEYVEGVASAESALLLAPELYGQAGYFPVPAPGLDGEEHNDGFRLLGGARYRLSALPEGLAVRRRANADCRRHKAADLIQRETRRRALVARARVLDESVRELSGMVGELDAAVAARRTTAQAAISTRLRLEELRRLADETRGWLAELPESKGSIAGALAGFQRADGDLEAAEATVRRSRAFEVDIRGGIDVPARAEPGDTKRYFGFVTASVNLGVLWQGRGNARAAKGRRELARTGSDAISPERTTVQVETATRRVAELTALDTELTQQLAAIDRVGGDDVRTVRELVWFELVKVRAERAYNEAMLGALREVLGVAR